MTFPWPAKVNLNSIPVGWGWGGQWLQITDLCINNTLIFLSFCRFILTSKEDIRWISGITSGEGGKLNKDMKSGWNEFIQCVKRISLVNKIWYVGGQMHYLAHIITKLYQGRKQWYSNIWLFWERKCIYRSSWVSVSACMSECGCV